MTFDPYSDWLGISAEHRPPSHYDLLGLDRFEADQEQITSAATSRTAAVRRYLLGPHGDDAQKIINQLAVAFACLSDARAKEAYDDQLRGEPTIADDLTTDDDQNWKTVTATIPPEGLPNSRPELPTSPLTLPGPRDRDAQPGFEPSDWLVPLACGIAVFGLLAVFNSLLVPLWIFVASAGMTCGLMATARLTWAHERLVDQFETYRRQTDAQLRQFRNQQG